MGRGSTCQHDQATGRTSRPIGAKFDVRRDQATGMASTYDSRNTTSQRLAGSAPPHLADGDVADGPVKRYIEKLLSRLFPAPKLMVDQLRAIEKRKC